jgi:hypothetical protein
VLNSAGEILRPSNVKESGAVGEDVAALFSFVEVAGERKLPVFWRSPPESGPVGGLGRISGFILSVGRLSSRALRRLRNTLAG